MHQHQLLAFASLFGILGLPASPSSSFTSPDYPENSFLSSTRSSLSKVTPLQFKHLQQHCLIVHSLGNLQDPELVNLNQHVQIWRRYQNDKTIFHCVEYERKNSTRLKHSVLLQ